MNVATHIGESLCLIAAWLLYFALHSLFASLRGKQWAVARWPGVMVYYRLVFNSVALVLLVPPLWLLSSHPGPWLWRWEGLGGWVSMLSSLAALGGFLWSMKYYDMAEFLGLRQFSSRIQSVEDQESFHLSPMHRHVRHPWYFIALLLIWTRDMNVAMLLSAVLMTLYFIVGSRLEERKLVQYHGPVYQRYMQRVPGLVPLPWRYLNKHDAEELIGR